MRFAISNIAWDVCDNEVIAEAMTENGFEALEIAPTKLLQSPIDAAQQQIDKSRKWWIDKGISIVAAQALLFGRPELTIFDDPKTTALTADYIGKICKVCAALGAEALVFGSPKNRRVPSGMTKDKAWDIAIDFFSNIAEQAHNQGTKIVIEANPEIYNANFITTSEDAIRLVELVNHPGLALHLDTACITMAGEDIEETIISAGKYLYHFHISEPYLEPIFSSGKIDHAAAAKALKHINYNRYLSVEMKQTEDYTPQKIYNIMKSVREVYN